MKAYRHIVDILCNDPRWEQDISFDLKTLVRGCFDTTVKHIVEPILLFELSVLLTNDNEIQSLNREYRKIDKSTNVLSFESGVSIQHLSTQQIKQQDRYIPLGDIVFSYETLLKEAAEQNKTFQDHFTHLLIHGLLHLFGFDHEMNYEADVMEAIEVEILKIHFHIKNPYNADR